MGIETSLAVLIGAGLATAGTVASGVISSKAQDKANQANKDLQLQNQAYQTSERLAAQEYNTPVHQRQRFEQAGINPYMALGNISAGETTAQTGVQQPTIQPNLGMSNAVSQLGNIASSGINQYADLNIKEEQANQLGIDNKLKAVDLMYSGSRQLMDLYQRQQELINSKLDEGQKRKMLRQLDLQIDSMETSLKYLDDYEGARTQEQKNRADYVNQQVIGQKLQNKATEIANDYASRINEATLAKLNAEAAAAWSQASLNGELKNLANERSRTEFEMRIINKALGHSELKNRDILQSYLGEQISTAIELQKTQILQGKQDIENPFRYFGNAILGAGAGAALKGVGSAAKAGASSSTNNYLGNSYGLINTPW